MTIKVSRTSLGRFVGWAAALAGAALGTAVPAQAQAVDPSAAPAEWVRYAQDATAEVTRLLEADSEPAARLRAYLHAARPSPDQPTAPLLIKLWVDADGTVSRIDFTPFTHSEPNADLRTLLVGQRLPGTPPKGILLPLRIQVQLDAPAPVPNPEAATPGTASGT